MSSGGSRAFLTYGLPFFGIVLCSAYALSQVRQVNYSTATTASTKQRTTKQPGIHLNSLEEDIEDMQHMAKLKDDYDMVPVNSSVKN